MGDCNTKKLSCIAIYMYLKGFINFSSKYLRVVLLCTHFVRQFAGEEVRARILVRVARAIGH